jgi:hypothetical protein
MRHRTTILLMIFSLGSIQAQVPDTSHSDKSYIFSLYSGFAKYIERDGAMSPYKYRGQTIPIAISYRYAGSKWRQLFYVNFDNLRLRSSLPNYENTGLSHYVKSTDIQIGYSFLRRAIRLIKCNSDLYFGAELNSLLNLRKHAYVNNNELLMLDQFNSLGFKA